MDILVTGASGFIGSRLIVNLLMDGHEVYGISRSRPRLCEHRSFHWIRSELESGKGFDLIPWERIDIVYHLAASGVKSVSRKWKDGIHVNILGQFNLLSYVYERAFKRPKLFIARTCYELFDYPDVLKIDNPYIMTKKLGYEYAKEWALRYGGVTIFGMYFQVFGSGDNSSNVANYIKDCLKKGEACQLSSGSSKRDWIFIDDAVSGTLCSVEQKEKSGVYFYDIGMGNLLSVKDFSLKLCDAMGADPALLEFDKTRDREDKDIEMLAQKKPSNWNLVKSLDQRVIEFVNS